MFEQILAFFRSQDWAFNILDNEKAVAFLGIGTQNGNFQFVADVQEEEKRAIFYSICEINTPENKKVLMCELLTRLNYGKFLGNFEMDWEEGKIRYKTSMYYKGISENLSSTIEGMVMFNIIMMDKALPAILHLINDDVSALEAFSIIDIE